ncbi:hypothetical protein HPB48_018255 [Haemaphysalis longicornis]|uniref:Uncharacterized protein n=1 Tax=Haemaphysalis longicornis TaxID=44386 RepID=A0A9J6FS45_HAELO|nr:hypothetical protein HPB48_018255 [Haemaphysalis longicornis]
MGPRNPKTPPGPPQGIFLDTENHDCLEPHDLPTIHRSLLPPGADHNRTAPDRLQDIATGVLTRLVAAHFRPPFKKVSQGKRQRLFGRRLLAPVDDDQDGGPFQMHYECAAGLLGRHCERALPEWKYGPVQATSAGPYHSVAREQISAEQPGKRGQSQPAPHDGREVRPDNDLRKSGYRRMEAMRSFCPLSEDPSPQATHLKPGSATFQPKSRPESPGTDPLRSSLVTISVDSLRTLKPQIEEQVDLFLLVFDHHKEATPLRRRCLRTIAASAAESAQAFTTYIGAAKLNRLVGRLLTIVIEGSDPSCRPMSLEESTMAKEALLHLFLSPKGDALLPVASETVCTLLRSADWRRRHRGLTTLEQLCRADSLAASSRGYECTVLLFDACFDCLFRCLYDTDVRVRNEAIEVLSRNVSCLSPAYVRSSNARIIPDLLAFLAPGGQAEVINVAAVTLAHYFLFCPQEVVISYLGLLFYKLGALFTGNSPCEIDYAALAEAVLTTIATMAELLQACFRAFYDDFVPVIMELTTSLGITESRLRWVALESVVRIGLTVGKPQFIADAPTIGQAVLTLLSDRWHWGNDRILGRAMSVALSLSRALDDDCGAFVLQVLPLAFQIFSRGDNGLVRFRANTCALIEWYALYAREGFASYVDEAVCRVLPLLLDPYPSVRAAASECFARLLACIPTCGATRSTDRWVHASAALTSAIEKENDLSAVLSQLCALEQLFGLIWIPLVPAHQIEAATAALDKCFELYFRWNRPAGSSSASLDGPQLSARQRRQREDGMHQALLQETADVVRTLVSQLKENYFPFFDRLAPLVSKLLTKPRPWTEHLHGLQIIVDVLSLGATACNTYSSYYLPEIVELIDSNAPPVKAKAAMAVAILAELGGSNFGAPCVSAVPALARAVAGSKSRFPEESLAAELSMVALSRIMEHHWGLPEMKALVDDLFPLFLSWVPMLRDGNLGPPVELLCSLMEGDDAVAMQNATQVVLVLVDALAHGHVSKRSALSDRLTACLQRQTRESVTDEAAWRQLQNLLGSCQPAESGGNVGKPSSGR